MTIEQRMERLELQNRRLRRAVIGVVAVGLSLLVIGANTPPKVHDLVKAKRFWVIGDDGRMKVVMASVADSGMIAVVGRSEEKPVALISATSDGNGSFTTYSTKQKPLVLIRSDGKGNGAFTVNDSNGRHLITIFADDKGEGRIVKFNRAGKPKAVWP